MQQQQHQSNTLPVWKSTSVSRAPNDSSLSHFSAMTWPRWLCRAARNRHRQAIEQASRRWRGGRRDDSARTRRKILISTQAGTWSSGMPRCASWRATAGGTTTSSSPRVWWSARRPIRGSRWTGATARRTARAPSSRGSDDSEAFGVRRDGRDGRRVSKTMVVCLTHTVQTGAIRFLCARAASTASAPCRCRGTGARSAGGGTCRTPGPSTKINGRSCR